MWAWLTPPPTAIPTSGNDDPWIDTTRQLAKRTYEPGVSAPWLDWTQKRADPMGEWKLFTDASGQAVLAFRGTVDTRDVQTDFMMIGGSLADRFQRSLNVAQDIIRTNGNVKLTGHSLGGTLALWVSHRLGIPAIAFAPYVNSRMTGFSYTDRMTVVVNRLDPVSYETYEYREYVPGYASAKWVVETRLPNFWGTVSDAIGHGL